MVKKGASDYLAGLAFSKLDIVFRFSQTWLPGFQWNWGRQEALHYWKKFFPSHDNHSLSWHQGTHFMWLQNLTYNVLILKAISTSSDLWQVSKNEATTINLPSTLWIRPFLVYVLPLHIVLLVYLRRDLRTEPSFSSLAELTSSC